MIDLKNSLWLLNIIDNLKINFLVELLKIFEGQRAKVHVNKKD